VGVELVKKPGVVGGVQGQLRLYGKAGLDTASSGDANYREQLVDAGKGKPAAKFSAVGGAALDVEFLGAMREALALEIKYELPLGSTLVEGRERSATVGSAAEYEAAAAASAGRPRSDAMGSGADAQARSSANATRARSDAVGSEQEYEARGQESAGASRLRSFDVPGEVTKAVRLCGFTIRLDQPEGMRPSGLLQDGSNQSGRLGPKNLVPGGLTAQFMVGPVPLLVRANAGVGIEYGLAPFAELDGQRKVGLEATAGAYLNGWVSAGVGAGCRFASVCAGVKADLRLVDFTDGIRLGFDLNAMRPLAQLFFKLTPASLKLSLIAYFEVFLGFARIGKSFELPVWQWSAPALIGVIAPIGA
jgi:hypothetical protein